MSDTIEVFISYSKQDKELRDGLLAHLDVLRGEGIITWHDRQILPGTEWDEEIKARLNAADIILLLISAAFLNTDYCKQVEIPEALRRHAAGEATVMPVILRSCGWKYTPLSAIQAYPEKAKPIVTWTYIDDAYTDVVDAVYLAAIKIKERRNQQQQVAEEKLRAEQLRQQQAAAERLKQEELERQRQVQREQEKERQNQQRQAEEEKLRAEQLRQQQAAAERLRQEELERQQQEQLKQELASEKGIDYTRLRDLLKAGQLQEADQETAKKMCEVMGRQKEGWLRIEDIEQFSCTDLRTIDRLWVKYSDGKFGFSVQKRIWQECGSPTGHNADWEEFCDRVSWRVKGRWISFSGVTFGTFAPSGHLPSLGFVGVAFWVGWCRLFFSRATTCKL